jgi:hypothetical protein
LANGASTRALKRVQRDEAGFDVKFNEQTRRHTTVPHHNRDLPHGTVSAIIQQAGQGSMVHPRIRIG